MERKPSDEFPSEEPEDNQNPQWEKFREYHPAPTQGDHHIDPRVEAARRETTRTIEALRQFEPSGDLREDADWFFQTTRNRHISPENTREDIIAYLLLIRGIEESDLNPLSRTYASLTEGEPDYEDRLALYRDLPTEQLRVIDLLLADVSEEELDRVRALMEEGARQEQVERFENKKRLYAEDPEKWKDDPYMDDVRQFHREQLNQYDIPDIGESSES